VDRIDPVSGRQGGDLLAPHHEEGVIDNHKGAPPASTSVAKAASISVSVLAFRIFNSNPSLRVAGATSALSISALALFGLMSM
jgi:hypothetical protein